MNNIQLVIFLFLFLAPLTVAIILGLLVSPWGWMALTGEVYTLMYPLFILSGQLSEEERNNK